MNSDIEIRKAEEKDISLICQMAVTRMLDTTETSYLLKDISDKEGLLTQAFNSQMEHVYRIGEVWMAGEYQGLLAVFNGKKSSLLRAIQSALDFNNRIGKHLTKADLKQLQANTKQTAGANNFRWRKKICGNSNYYYIQLVAIDKTMKGSGILRKLMQPVLERAEQENVPVLIDTHDKDNIPIYEHFGFELAIEHHAKKDPSIVQYSMIKRP